MTVRELRDKYLQFFESKGHRPFPSGSLIPYDVTGRLDESLLFNGAGMVQFKPYFRGVAEPPHRRLTNAQKCVRTGDIEAVGDATHLTFFEMLGNFSFGDYFKAQAIAFSWEFLTSPEWLGLDPMRLSFTVFEEDDEAYDEWSRWLIPAGLNPEHRIFRLGEDTNYWPAGAFSGGPPGPCGPNSEMFYWASQDEPPPTGPYTREDWIRDDAAGKWIEIWNDVFIQYEWQGHLKNPDRPSDGWQKDAMPPLPFPSIDTGMGVERTITVLNGKDSVYDNDAFAPIFAKLESLGPARYGQSPESDRAMRIIADHIRTSVFCIADGVLPGNTGRGYVLRRLIRRAVLKGQRALGFERAFFHEVYEGVAEAMGDHYTELRERRDVIVETLRNEEALFRRTLAAGSALLQEEIERLRRTGASTLSGGAAFRLYDTYGFPLEVTQELCEEAGLAVDQDGYEAALREAQERSRGAGGMDTVYGSIQVTFHFVDSAEDKPTPTQFLGYETTRTRSRIVAAMPQFDEAQRPTGLVVLALDQTPFYAESGGQISDEGLLCGPEVEMKVLDMHKQDGLFVHLAEPIRPANLGRHGPPEELTREVVERLVGRDVEAMVDESRRRRIMRNHTATHLLHAALRSVLGGHVTQAGSYVGPDRLRFDFTHGRAMTSDEVAHIERIVNEQALANHPVTTYVDIPVAEAKARGAMALFGEKYGDRVRMVEIGDFSRELCGGTHVRSTGEIGLFKIVSEASAASGVRRIEALTGEGAYDWMVEETRRLREGAALLKASPRDLVPAIEKLVEQGCELNRRFEKLRAQGPAGAGVATTNIGEIELATQKLTEGEAKDATLAADRLVENMPLRVAVVGLAADGKVTIVAKVGPDAKARGAHAGNLAREIAKIAGGGGGGGPDFATAGGRLPEKLDEALAAAPELLGAMATGG